MKQTTKGQGAKEVTASYLDQRIAQFRAEHDKMMVIDNELFRHCVSSART